MSRVLFVDIYDIYMYVQLDIYIYGVKWKKARVKYDDAFNR
jgi:hypothetical protein